MKNENDKTNHSLKDGVQWICLLPFESFQWVTSCSSYATSSSIIATCWLVVGTGRVIDMLKIAKICIGQKLFL